MGLIAEETFDQNGHAEHRDLLETRKPRRQGEFAEKAHAVSSTIVKPAIENIGLKVDQSWSFFRTTPQKTPSRRPPMMPKLA
jgi:hypothetical protein